MREIVYQIEITTLREIYLKSNNSSISKITSSVEKKVVALKSLNKRYILIKYLVQDLLYLKYKPQYIKLYYKNPDFNIKHVINHFCKANCTIIYFPLIVYSYYS